ncbi:MAG: NUDIX domain-containing protein, partial [Myxococcota bacterium]
MSADHAEAEAEQRFLERYDPRSFPPMAVAVDVALITAEGGSLHALLRRRRVHPARDRWSLLGGFVGPDEPLDETARRVLRERAGLDGVFLEQLYTFG